MNEFEELFTGIEVRTAEDLAEYVEKVVTLYPIEGKRYGIDKNSLPQFFDAIKTFGLERIRYGEWGNKSIVVSITENRSGIIVLFRDRKPDKPVQQTG